MSTQNDKSHHFVLQREASNAPFVAQIGDDTVTLAPMADLDQFELARLFGSGDDMTIAEFRVAVLSLAANDEDLATLRAARLNGKEMSALFNAYTAHGGMSEGESSASSA
jgi:hypothetical protein